MILLLIAYLYKFQLKPRLNKLFPFLQKPNLSLALQPVEK